MGPRDLSELGEFAWQEGYSVFSVSKSREEAVKKYIAGQAEHHKEDFKSELLRILCAYGVEFDEKYVFDEPALDRAIPLPLRGRIETDRVRRGRLRSTRGYMPRPCWSRRAGAGYQVLIGEST